MKRVGFQNVKALKGGIVAWVKAGYPVEPEEARAKVLEELQELGEMAEI